MICTHNPDATYKYVSPAAYRIVGTEAKEMIGKSPFDFIHPEDVKLVQDYSYQKIIEGLEPKNVQFRFINSEGNYIWLEAFAEVVVDDRGEMISFTTASRNINELKEVEFRLKESEANLKSLFESTNNVIGLFDKENKLVEYNRAFQEAAKQSDDIDLFKGIDLYNREEQDVEKASFFKSLNMRALAGENVKEHIEYETPDGIFSLLFNYNPIYQNEDIIGVSLFVEDITQLKKSQTELEHYAENLENLVKQRTQELSNKNEELKVGNDHLYEALRELKAAQAKLIQSEKMASLGILSAGIGHEINNPLNFIKNGVSGLFEEIQHAKGFDDEIFAPYFRIIQDGVDRASKIVKSLSHFSRHVDSNQENCKVHEILDNCLTILNSKVNGRIQVIRNYASSQLVILANEGRLHQAFLNLLSNAEQSIAKNGTITISTFKREDRVVVEIEDTGEGISDENISKIGDPFFTTKDPGVGTGLGMFITYDIIKELKGDWELESELNKGTIVRVFLCEKNEYGTAP